MTTVSITYANPKEKTMVKYDLVNNQSREVFEKFKGICERMSALYSAEYSKHVSSFDKCTNVIGVMADSGFECRVSKDLHADIYARAEAIDKDMASVRKRIDRWEAKLAKRKLKLYSFQRNGVEWLAPRRRAILADEMGLGKTIQCLMSIKSNEPTIVFCPSSVKSVWHRECVKWRKDLTAFIFSGRGSLSYWPEPGQVFIINYDILPGSPPKNCPPNVRIIVDEAHCVKNVNAKRTKFTRLFADAIFKKHGRGILTSGTPMLNRPNELFSVLETFGLATEAYGSWENFVRVFNGTKDGPKWEWGTPFPEAAQMLQTVCLMRKRKDVMKELPTKSYQTFDFNIQDKNIIKAMDNLKKAMEKSRGIEIEDMTLEDFDELKADKFVFNLLSKTRAMLARAKVPMIIEMVEEYEENDTPVVVFCAHKAPIMILEQRRGWAAIHGGVPVERRAEIVEDFQKGKYKGIALTIAAGGVGLTLTHASHSIFVDTAWTPAMNWQAEDRVCRIGQKNAVLIKHLVSNHVVEQHVHKLLEHKRHIIEHGVDAAAVSGETSMVSYNANLAALDHKNVAAGDAVEKTEEQADKAIRRILSNKNIARMEAEDINRPHGPATNLEKWIFRYMVELSGNGSRNHSGLSRFKQVDQVVGTDLAIKMLRVGLTADQWYKAGRLLGKYESEIGKAPEMLG